LTLDEWFDNQIKPKYEAYQIEKEYPESLEQALAPPKVTCRFSVDALTQMMADCESPLRMEWNGLVKIYKDPIPGRRYVFAIDPSEGDYDPSAGIVMDTEYEEVAEYHGKIGLDEQAKIAFYLWEKYNRAYIAPERNAAGLNLIKTLSGMGVNTFHIYGRDKLGWWTSSSNRGPVITDLAEMVRMRQLKIRNEDIIQEFLSFVKTDRDPNGKARGGAHDDYVMAWAIAVQLRKSIPSGKVKVSSFKWGEQPHGIIEVR
jgi:phage terminase large subunit-like protein